MNTVKKFFFTMLLIYPALTYSMEKSGHGQKRRNEMNAVSKTANVGDNKNKRRKKSDITAIQSLKVLCLKKLCEVSPQKDTLKKLPVELLQQYFLHTLFKEFKSVSSDIINFHNVTKAISVYIDNIFYIVMSDRMGNLCIYDCKHKTIKKTKAHESAIVSICSAIDEKGSCLIITGTKNGNIRVWDFKTLSKVNEVQAHDNFITSLLATCINGVAYIISTSLDTKIKVWRLNNLEFVKSFLYKVDTGNEEFDKQFNTQGPKSIALQHSNGIWYLSAIYEEKRAVWNFEDCVKLIDNEIIFERCFQKVNSITDVNFNYYMYAKSSGEIDITHMENMRNVLPQEDEVSTYKRTLKLHSSPITNIIPLVVNNLPYLISTDRMGKIKISNIQNLICIKELVGHKKPIIYLQPFFIKNRPYIVSASLDKTIRIWDFETGTEIGQTAYNNFIHSIFYHEDIENNRCNLFCFCSDGTLYAYDIFHKIEDIYNTTLQNECFAISEKVKNNLLL